jgi:hypothetical protein
MQENMVKIPDPEESVSTRGGGGGAARSRDGPAQVEADAADILPRVDGSRVNEGMPRPKDASSGKAPAPGPFGIVDFGANELGLLGYPRALPLSASWRQVEGGAEPTCSKVVIASRLLKEMLATVGWDVLHPTRVSLKTERKIFTSVSLALSRFPDFCTTLGLGCG